ncbi:MAG: class I SAM-dependent RNA methyltransferase [Terriglobia bacterium]|nr:MAG: class I SAM-dependent RNA methyltransferase [Terriglobia bacterium]
MPFDLTVDKLVYGGDGLGRVDGRVVLAPYVLAGERVRVQPEQEKPGLVRASTLEVLEEAAGRVAPPCPYFARCGGCHYQHMNYEAQLAAKRSILAEELQRLGKIEPPETIEIIAAEPWGYRNRAQFHIEGHQLGYRRARSHELCAIEHCPISSPRINDTIGVLNDMLRDARWPGFVRSLEIFTDEQQVQLNILDTSRPVARRFFDWCAERIPGLVAGALDYQGRYRVSSNSFFQVNRFLVDRLVMTAVEGTQGESALDLYAGAGLFALALAQAFSRVTAVESGSAAVRDLRFNAERAGRSNIVAEQSTTEAWLERLEQAPDFVLLDPPRAGLGKVVVRRLAELRPPLLAIVSCDPATLARDMAGLLAAGYRIEKMIVADLFPQTYHVETVVKLAV